MATTPKADGSADVSTPATPNVAAENLASGPQGKDRNVTETNTDEVVKSDLDSELVAAPPTRTVVTEQDQKIVEAARAEAQLRAENPDLVIVREANPDFGGHSMDVGGR